MEYFADAVFAIALTLPVTTLELPAAGPDYAARLAALWPSYLAYALTALVIGIYWAHHHFSGAIYRTTGHYFLLATILFLTTIGFVDFPTRAFAERIADPEARASGAIWYSVALAACALSWWVKWSVGRSSGHIDQRLDPAYVDRLSRKYGLSALLHVAAAGLSFVRWEIGLGLAACVTLFYLRAPETPVYRIAAPTVEEEQ